MKCRLIGDTLEQRSTGINKSVMIQACITRPAEATIRLLACSCPEHTAIDCGTDGT